MVTWDLEYRKLYGDEYFGTKLPNWTIEDTVEVENMILFGRVFWSALRKAGLNDDMLRNFATAKITKLAGIKTIEDIGLFALLASLTVMEISPHYGGSLELVRSYMAHIDYYSRKYKCCYVSYPSDPYLASVVETTLRTEDDWWGGCLDVFDTFLKHKIISTGDRGELVGQLLCLMVKSRLKAPIITVLDFLNVLVGGDGANNRILEDFNKNYKEQISKELFEWQN